MFNAIFYITVLLMYAPELSWATEKFEVTRLIKGCKYVVLETSSDYILVEDWLCTFSRSSDGFGELKSYGFKDIILDGSQCKVYVDNFMLSKSSALEKQADKCSR